ncbi:3-hydroxyacyl-CoA dehydrogenase NAD-binding domain-containing protein [Pararhodobacter sp.]|uniref:3-hydroxyacyl-CoA dehydrogenase NAD-binding domain-containing protein n=1 Tax=Pararhodobacter sp. TaxID=2127056 RepID=UPI002B001C95|nr:3-hydroxyacyl-CoA dehydrogenase NAD-binding domain-containing protein [Pararhodobacter sp.]
MTPPVTLTRDGDLAILLIDNPPVNALSPVTIAALQDGFAAFEADRDAVALVIACAGRTFIAGGDITAFDDPGFSAAPLNALLDRIEASDRPVVVALHGTVLGGGLEVAMAAHHRIAHPATRLGMPEITLGLIPGSLGTQRLPRLAGLAKALEMIATGAPITADAAKAAGILDALADDPGQAARIAAKQLATSPAKPRRTSALTVAEAADPQRMTAVLDDAAARAAAKPWLPALAAIEPCLRAACGPFAEGAAVEAEAFARLVASPSSRALRHIFLAERAAARIPGLPADTITRPVKRVGILGVGTMGGGIAMSFANAGYEVILVDTTQAALDRGVGLIEANYAASVKRGRLSEMDAAARRARMAASIDLKDLADVDLVIEAVFEDLEIKLDVARQLGAICKPGAIIATNTSTLDVDQIAAATGRASDVLGTHFFSPAQVMRLLEIVRGRETAPEVLATLMGLAKKIGKTAVVSGVCYGFIGNRMAEVYMRESEQMQMEGATPQDIDAVAEDPTLWGMAMGPNRMLDMAGVDVGARTVIEWMKSGSGPHDPAYRALCRAMYDQGAHGQKTGHGYYRYEGRLAHPNPETQALAAELATTHSITRRTLSRDEIFERLLFPMVNEAAQILDEGIAYRPGDIDVVWTAGYGFPAWRGGPLFMADQIGLARIVARMDHYAATLGNERGDWTVAPLLRKLAQSGVRISDLQATANTHMGETK